MYIPYFVEIEVRLAILDWFFPALSFYFTDFRNTMKN